MNVRQRQASEMARKHIEICAEWLRTIIVLPGEKAFTKAQLRDEAIRRLGVSRNAFDWAWIDVIEELGRQDWYEPMRRRKKTLHHH